MTTMSGEIDSKHFRTVLGHLPTGVSVVTGVNGKGVKWGITIGSVVSVSLDPPLVASSLESARLHGHRSPKVVAFASTS
ncbi:MAG: flavin reductase [Actinobacteria bacterium]|nr:flavin reductase [Actinomycetota bacterium]